MTTPSGHILFDRAQLARHRDRAARTYQDYAVLKQRESTELLDRLRDVSRQFDVALDLGCHDGTAALGLLKSGQVQTVIGLERSAALAQKARASGVPTVQADEEALPFSPSSFDLVTSILSLHWINDLPGSLIQLRRCLKPDGLFLGCLFGGGTLSELRVSLLEAETELTGGAAARLSPLPGLQDMAGLLQRAGFALPVVDREAVTIRYGDPLQLIADLKGTGEQTAFARQPGTPRRPLSAGLISRMCEIYRDRFSDPDGKVRASFEIIWLSGWAPSPSQPKPLKPGTPSQSLADAVRGRRTS